MRFTVNPPKFETSRKNAASAPSNGSWTSGVGLFSQPKSNDIAIRSTNPPAHPEWTSGGSILSKPLKNSC